MTTKNTFLKHKILMGMCVGVGVEKVKRGLVHIVKKTYINKYIKNTTSHDAYYYTFQKKKILLHSS